jgi:hypothetical protein
LRSGPVKQKIQEYEERKDETFSVSESLINAFEDHDENHSPNKMN